MWETQSQSKDLELWNKVVAQEKAYRFSLKTFLDESQNPLWILKEALNNPSQRASALQLCCHLRTEERFFLFDDLVKLVSVGHSDIELARQAILSFPLEWLKQNFEPAAYKILEEGTDEEYRRSLELMIKFDLEMAKRLVQKSLASDEPDIREVGEDFHNYLAQAFR